MVKRIYFKLPEGSETVESLRNVLLRFYLSEFPAEFREEEITNQTKKLNTIKEYSDNGIYRTTIKGVDYEYIVGRLSGLEHSPMSEVDYLKNKDFIESMYGTM